MTIVLFDQYLETLLTCLPVPRSALALVAAQEDISTSFEVRVDRRVPVDEKSEQGAHLQNQEAPVTTSLDLPTNKLPKSDNTREEAKDFLGPLR